MRNQNITRHSRVIAMGLAMVFLGIGPVVQAGDQKTRPPWKVSPRRARKKNPIPSDARSIATGKVIYAKECLACHGATGKGDGPSAADLEVHPGDLSAPSMWQQSDGALFWKITQGRAPMPSYKKLLGDEQRWHVVNYVRTLAPKPTASSGDGSRGSNPGMAAVAICIPITNEFTVSLVDAKSKSSTFLDFQRGKMIPDGYITR